MYLFLMNPLYLRMAPPSHQPFSTWTRKFFKPVIDITRHYDCPPDCEETCCRRDTIGMDVADYVRITRRHPWTKETFEQQSTKEQTTTVTGKSVDVWTFTSHPCPLLNNHRCRIYGVRPVVCEVYPFTTKEGDPKDNLGIDPCPIGLEITKDFVLFKYVMSEPVITTGGRKVMRVLREDIENALVIVREAEDKFKGPVHNRVKYMYLPFALAEAFNEFLDKTSPEDRLHDRIEIGLD